MESPNVWDRISLPVGRNVQKSYICAGFSHGFMAKCRHSSRTQFGVYQPTHTQKPITKTEVCSVRAGHLTSPRFLDQLSTPPFFRSGRSAKLWGSSQLAFAFIFLVHLWEGRELWRFGGWGLRVQRWFVCVTKTSEFSGRWWRNAEVSWDGKKICKS